MVRSKGETGLIQSLHVFSLRQNCRRVVLFKDSFTPLRVIYLHRILLWFCRDLVFETLFETRERNGFSDSGATQRIGCVQTWERYYGPDHLFRYSDAITASLENQRIIRVLYPFRCSGPEARLNNG
jgi:hypothetical protein